MVTVGTLAIVAAPALVDVAYHARTLAGTVPVAILQSVAGLWLFVRGMANSGAIRVPHTLRTLPFGPNLAD